MKLDIGVRAPGKDGWTTVDIFPGADFLSPMWHLKTLSGPVSEIRAFHVLEHAPPSKVLPTLKEWHRVMVPGGHLMVEVPDLAECLALLLSEPETAFRLIYGNDDDSGMMHHWGFIESSLREAIVAAGFEEPRIERVRTFGAPALRAHVRRG